MVKEAQRKQHAARLMVLYWNTCLSARDWITTQLPVAALMIIRYYAKGFQDQVKAAIETPCWWYSYWSGKEWRISGILLQPSNIPIISILCGFWICRQTVVAGYRSINLLGRTFIVVAGVGASWQATYRFTDIQIVLNPFNERFNDFYSCGFIKKYGNEFL